MKRYTMLFSYLMSDADTLIAQEGVSASGRTLPFSGFVQRGARLSTSLVRSFSRFAEAN